ncbi:hypothetical protein HaLaN_29107, partial [Haematococcus lacustris]
PALRRASSLLTQAATSCLISANTTSLLKPSTQLPAKKQIPTPCTPCTPALSIAPATIHTHTQQRGRAQLWQGS